MDPETTLFKGYEPSFEYGKFIGERFKRLGIPLLIGLIIVLGIGQSPVQIIVQILLVGGLVRVFCIVDDIS